MASAHHARVGEGVVDLGARLAQSGAPTLRRLLESGLLDDARKIATSAPSDMPLAGLRLAHGSLRASHEALEDEVEALRGVRDERDRLNGELNEEYAAHIAEAVASGRDPAEARRAYGSLLRHREHSRQYKAWA